MADDAGRRNACRGQVDAKQSNGRRRMFSVLSAARWTSKGSPQIERNTRLLLKQGSHRGGARSLGLERPALWPAGREARASSSRTKRRPRPSSGAPRGGSRSSRRRWKRPTSNRSARWRPLRRRRRPPPLCPCLCPTGQCGEKRGAGRPSNQAG